MDILERIAVALERNNELLEVSNAGRDAAIAAAKAASEKVAGTKTKPAAAKEEPKTETPKEEKKPAAETTETETEDGPTVDDVNAAIKKYVGGTERTEERDARKAKVLGVLTKFSPEGTEKPNGGTLAADKRGAFIKTVDKWIAEGDLTEPAADESSDDGDGLLED